MGRARSSLVLAAAAALFLSAARPALGSGRTDATRSVDRRPPESVTATGAGTDAVDLSADWPSYGHDPANTRTSTGGPPAVAVPTLKQAWRLDTTDGDFTATPVVVGGTLYIGSNGGVVRALDVATGLKRWSVKVGGPVNGTVAVDGSEVVVPVATPSSPSVVALDKATGATRWSTVLDTQTNADVYGSPTVAGSVVYQGISGLNGDPNGTLRGGLVALDEASGKVRWHTYSVAPGHNGGAIWSTPAVDLVRRRIYAGTGNAYSGAVDAQTDSILELDLDGHILAHFQATPQDAFSTGSGGSVGPDFDFGASPNLLKVDGAPMVGEGQKAGSYWVLPSDLDPSRAQLLQLGPGTPAGGILGSTGYDGQRIYGPISVPGYLWSVGFLDGHLAPEWVSPGPVDVAHLSPVALSNGVVYSANSSGFLDARQTATGLLLAHLPLNMLPPGVPPTYNLAFGGVSAAEGMVFADTGTGGQTGSVVAFRP